MTPTTQELDRELRYRLQELERMSKEGRSLALGLLAIARRLHRLADRALDLVADLAVVAGHEDPPSGPDV